MPLDYLRVMTILPASAARVYAAWLDAEEHSRMTGGGKATVDAKVGGLHSAWDGYIAGKILELEEGERIVQSWRTSEFPEDHPHSRLEVRLRDVAGGCEITVVHSEIPEGQGAQYESGWQGHYFNPMTEYFRVAPAMPRAKPAKPEPVKTATKKPAKKAVKARAKAARKAKPAKKSATRKAPAKAKKPASAKKTAKKAAATPSKKKGARGKPSRARRAR